MEILNALPDEDYDLARSVIRRMYDKGQLATGPAQLWRTPDMPEGPPAQTDEEVFAQERAFEDAKAAMLEQSKKPAKRSKVRQAEVDAKLRSAKLAQTRDEIGDARASLRKIEDRVTGNNAKWVREALEELDRADARLDAKEAPKEPIKFPMKNMAAPAFATSAQQSLEWLHATTDKLKRTTSRAERKFAEVAVKTQAAKAFESIAEGIDKTFPGASPSPDLKRNVHIPLVDRPRQVVSTFPLVAPGDPTINITIPFDLETNAQAWFRGDHDSSIANFDQALNDRWRPVLLHAPDARAFGELIGRGIERHLARKLYTELQAVNQRVDLATLPENTTIALGDTRLTRRKGGANEYRISRALKMGREEVITVNDSKREARIARTGNVTAAAQYSHNLRLFARLARELKDGVITVDAERPKDLDAANTPLNRGGAELWKDRLIAGLEALGFSMVLDRKTPYATFPYARTRYETVELRIQFGKDIKAAIGSSTARKLDYTYEDTPRQIAAKAWEAVTKRLAKETSIRDRQKMNVPPSLQPVEYNPFDFGGLSPSEVREQVNLFSRYLTQQATQQGQPESLIDWLAASADPIPADYALQEKVYETQPGPRGGRLQYVVGPSLGFRLAYAPSMPMGSELLFEAEWGELETKMVLEGAEVVRSIAQHEAELASPRAPAQTPVPTPAPAREAEPQFVTLNGRVTEVQDLHTALRAVPQARRDAEIKAVLEAIRAFEHEATASQKRLIERARTELAMRADKLWQQSQKFERAPKRGATYKQATEHHLAAAEGKGLKVGKGLKTPYIEATDGAGNTFRVFFKPRGTHAGPGTKLKDARSMVADRREVSTEELLNKAAALALFRAAQNQEAAASARVPTSDADAPDPSTPSAWPLTLHDVQGRTETPPASAAIDDWRAAALAATQAARKDNPRRRNPRLWTPPYSDEPIDLDNIADEYQADEIAGYRARMLDAVREEWLTHATGEAARARSSVYRDWDTAHLTFAAPGAEASFSTAIGVDGLPDRIMFLLYAPAGDTNPRAEEVFEARRAAERVPALIRLFNRAARG